jgi:hypothetical protein
VHSFSAFNARQFSEGNKGGDTRCGRGRRGGGVVTRFPCTGGGGKGAQLAVRHQRTVATWLLPCDGKRKGMRQMVLGWAAWAELGRLPGLLPGDDGGFDDCVFKKGKRKENLRHRASPSWPGCGVVGPTRACLGFFLGRRDGGGRQRKEEEKQDFGPNLGME